MFKRRARALYREVAMFDIKEFKAYLVETGTVPTNRYYVNIAVPRFIYNSQIIVNNTTRNLINITKDLEFRAEKVTIPGTSINTVQVNRYGVGPQQRFGIGAVMNDITIDFLADREQLIWMFFYQWMNNVFAFNQIEPNDVDSQENYYSYRASYMDDYATTITAFIYNYDGGAQNSTTVEIYDAYPVDLQQIDLGWSDNNNLMKIRVKFSYRDWRIVNTSTTDGSSKAPEPIPLSIPPRGNIVQEVSSTVLDKIRQLIK